MATKAGAKLREERVKLFATALANVGTASFIAGFVSPIFGGKLGPYSAARAFVFGIGFHALGQLVLQFVVVGDGREHVDEP